MLLYIQDWRSILKKLITPFKRILLYSNPVIRLQIEYEVLFHVLQIGNATVEASQCRHSNWCEGHWRE